MTTTSTAAETSGADKSKDKIEKRRALGRGLDSLLPGPRAVTPMHSTQSPARPATHLPSQSPAHTARPVDPRTPSSGGTAAAPPRSVVEMSDAEREAQKLVVAAATDLGIEIEEKPLAEADPEQSREGSGAVPFPSAVQEHAQTAHLGEGTNHSAGNERVASDQLAGLPGEPAPVHVADIVQLPLDDIDRNPFQTRNVQSGEPLDELADSIRANGVLQPIVVRPAKEKGRYVLIVGERRLLASRKAGRTTIPVIVRKVSEQQAAEMTIIENLQREDLSPLEQAKAFKTLSEHFHLTQQQIGERVGLSRESVSNYMRLLRLPPQVMQLLAEKRIKFAEARELLRLQNDDQIAQAALFAVKKGMNLEQIERLVMRMEGLLDPVSGMPATKKNSGARWMDPNVKAAQTELERILGLRVKIRDRMGKGRIVIEYSTVDDYERVVSMLGAK